MRHRLAAAVVAVLVVTGLVACGTQDDPGPPATTAGSTRTAVPREPPPPPPPVVWVQAGHAEPREPGYRAQTGAGSGPFGDEVGFTTRLSAAVVRELRSRGVDARTTPGQVTPLGADGAAFVSLHHDAPGGTAVIGAARAGTSENYYRGEGFGDPSPTPYPDSAPHRPASEVTPEVARRSLELAESIALEYALIATPANGSGSGFAGVADASNPRLANYYGFFRTNADARVIVEAGAAGADDAFLAQIDLIADAITAGTVDYLEASGLLDAPG